MPLSFLLIRVGEKIIQIIKTPHEKVVAESEAEQVLAGMGAGAKNKDNEHVKNLNNIVKEAEKKTGGML